MTRLLDMGFGAALVWVYIYLNARNLLSRRCR